MCSASGELARGKYSNITAARVFVCIFEDLAEINLTTALRFSFIFLEIRPASLHPVFITLYLAIGKRIAVVNALAFKRRGAFNWRLRRF